MRGIVMDILNDKVIIFTKDGEFLKIDKPGNQVDIGDEITVSKLNKRNQLYRRVASIAAAIIMIILGSYGVYGYYNPYGYINVDINPSIEISYNLYGRVLDIRGLNEDGNLIISKLEKYKYKSISTILNNVLDNAIEEDYIKENEENIVLVTVTEKGRKIDEEDIQESIKQHIVEVNTDAEIMVIEGDKETYESAKKDKVSPGKLMLVSKALKVNSDISPSDIINKPVKEIVSIIKEAKKNNEDKNKDKDPIDRKEDKDKGNSQIKDKDYDKNRVNNKNEHEGEKKDNKSIPSKGKKDNGQKEEKNKEAKGDNKQGSKDEDDMKNDKKNISNENKNKNPQEDKNNQQNKNNQENQNKQSRDNGRNNKDNKPNKNIRSNNKGKRK
jgi:hypothetical protein